jgi:hypothetical protein
MMLIGRPTDDPKQTFRISKFDHFKFVDKTFKTVLSDSQNCDYLTPKKQRSFEKLLLSIFDHRGYVAGGFARVSALSFLKGDQSLDDYMLRNRGQNIDIDVFFNDNAGFLSFCEEARALGFETSRSLGGFCQDIIISIGFKVQAVSFKFAPPEEQMRAFDIVNAMVAFTSDKLIISDEWFKHEAKNEIHVANWHSRMTLKRIGKWTRRHNIDNVSEQTAKNVSSMVFDLLSEYNSKISSLKEKIDPDDVMLSHVVSTTPFSFSNTSKSSPYQEILELQAKKNILVFDFKKLLKYLPDEILTFVYGIDEDLSYKALHEMLVRNGMDSLDPGSVVRI